MRCFLCTLYSGCAPPYPAGAGRRRVVGLPSWTLSHYSTTNKTTTYCTDIFPDSGDTSLSPKKPHSTANRCKLTVGSGMWFFLGRVPSSRTHVCIVHRAMNHVDCLNSPPVSTLTRLLTVDLRMNASVSVFCICLCLYCICLCLYLSLSLSVFVSVFVLSLSSPLPVSCRSSSLVL